MPAPITPDVALRSESDLEPVLAKGRWLVFKHSTRCPISAHAHQELHDWMSRAGPTRPKVALCLVVEARAASNAVGKRLGVRHESPQAILIEDGKVLWHASHSEITASELAARCG